MVTSWSFLCKSNQKSICLDQIFGQNYTLYTLNHRSVSVVVTILVKRSLWMGPKQKKRPWLCRIDQSLYCLVIHCCETRGEYHKTFWSACAFGKSHYGWESKWFCGFQLISVIDHITQRVMADRFICKQKYGGRLQWPWKWLHKKFIHSFLTSKVKTTSFIYFPSRSTSLLVALFSHFCYCFDCRMWKKFKTTGFDRESPLNSSPFSCT